MYLCMVVSSRILRLVCVLKDSEAVLAVTLRAFDHRLPKDFQRLVMVDVGLVKNPTMEVGVGGLSRSYGGSVHRLFYF